VNLTEQKFKTVFIFLDTDKYASPFDMLVTIDAFPEATILKYESVTGADAAKIVYDTIFPRGPEGAKHTKIFINGSDLKQVNDVLEKTRKCMFPPFENSIIVDPRGAYSTAAAAVSKTLGLALEKGFGSLENKSVTVLAGTGPVGQTAVKLYASEKAKVTITSRSLQKATALAAQTNQEVGEERTCGVEVQTAEQTGNAIKNAEIVLAAGAGGIQLLSADALKKYGGNCKIVADVNAIPPVGVEGLESTVEGKEIRPGVYGIGALAIGRLKIKIETELIKRATEEPKGLFDYGVAYEIGKNSVLKKLAKAAK
jgi:methylene-tetrahydromethanopterin dehydrogenase